MENKGVNIIVPQFKNYKQEIILFEDIEDMTPVTIHLPDPPNKRNVFNYNVSTANQKWVKQPLPKSFLRFKGKTPEEIYPLLTKEEHEFIMEEYDRILNKGFFFYNNGELMWLPPTNYMWLNWWQIDIGSPKFKVCQWELFIHWWKCVNDPDCFGLVQFTNRRFGKTFVAGCITYTETFTIPNALAGIQSKTDDDGRSVLSKAIVNPWKKLPFFFQPIFDSSNNPRQELRFFEPTSRGKASRINIFNEEALATTIQVRAAVDTAFDGEKLLRSLDDEIGKLIEGDINNRWDIKQHCLHVNGEIIGKEFATTTVGEMEKGGGDRFKTLWKNSDPGAKDKETGKLLKRTVSGLHRHFTPAQYTLVVDEFGRSDVKASLAIIEENLKKLKSNPAALSAYKRQFPRTIREAFRNTGKECEFDINIIDTRLEDFAFENPYVSYGYFERVGGEKDGRVRFVKVDNKNSVRAKFAVSYLFEDDKDSNKYIVRSNIRFPNNPGFGCAGGDPYKYGITKSRNPSRGSGVVFMLQNPIIDPDDKDVSQWKTHRFVCTYLNRPDQKEYGEDMIMMCQYYGVHMFPEINVPFLWNYFEERGYGGYLLFQKDHHFRTSATPGANTNDKSKHSIFTEFGHYINNHGHREVHPEILEAAREVEYDNLNPYDLFVAAGYALWGASMIGKRSTSPVKNISQPLFQTYIINL